MKLLTSIFSKPTCVPQVLNKNYYPSLNGLRGVSIIMVIVFHFFFRYRRNQVEPIHFIGPLGVGVFFVISGFLITSLCLKEQVQTGNLSLKSFYIRRGLRILPVAYLYLFTIFILNIIFHLYIATSRFLFAGFFLTNLSISQIKNYDWYTAHYWSLSTEEQFYLFFPFILKKNFKLFVALLLLICLGAPVVYYVQSLGHLNYNWATALIRYAIKFQSIGIGCLTAILIFKGYLDFKQYKLAITLLACLAICYFKYYEQLSVTYVIDNLITSILIALVIVCNIYTSKTFIFKILNSKLLSTIGILSYSIYIWQQPLLSNDSNFILSKPPYNFMLLLVIPVLSYYCFEKYFLRLKASFHKKPE